MKIEETLKAAKFKCPFGESGMGLIRDALRVCAETKDDDE